MQTIDKQGRLFGAINIVDALAVLVIIAAVLAGVALISGDSTSIKTVTVTGSTSVDEHVADAVVSSQTVIDDDVQSVSVDAGNATEDQVTLTITMDLMAERISAGAYEARNERLVVGRVLSIDFGTAIVSVRVVDIDPSGGNS